MNSGQNARFNTCNYDQYKNVNFKATLLVRCVE